MGRGRPPEFFVVLIRQQEAHPAWPAWNEYLRARFVALPSRAQRKKRTHFEEAMASSRDRDAARLLWNAGVPADDLEAMFALFFSDIKLGNGFYDHP